MAHFTSLCLFFFFTVVLGAPFEPREVYAPPITNPTSSSVWTVGDVETVTWNATGIPPGVLGMIQLGYLTPDSEHLSLTLASGFNLTDEKVNVTVPAVVSRTNYIVVLFGDSGNISPEFTIQGAPSVSGSGIATSTPPTSTGTFAIATSTSKSGTLSVTPSPPIATASSSAPISTATSPVSTSTSETAASVSSSVLSSSPLPTSSSTVPSPSPSPSSNAGWSVNNVRLFQVIVAPAALLLVL